MSTRILVIFTGGTIGSAVKDGYISPDSERRYHLIEEYRKISPYTLIYSGIDVQCSSDTDRHILQIDTIEPYRILSENMNGEYLNRLIDCIRTYLPSESGNNTFSNGDFPAYDGIIITHGTDTLQYTSAALGYVFANADIPIVLVSSNYILDDERANGLDNFYYAAEFISGHHGTGVFVSYRNGESTQLVHTATRVLPHMPYDDLLYSAGGICYGEFTGTNFLKTEQENTACPSDTAQQQSYTPLRHEYADIRLSAESPVLYIRPLPGQRYPSIQNKIKAILLDSYHSGTINTADTGIREFMREVCAMHIPVFLTGAENRTGYDSTRVYEELHIHVLPKASPIAMYMKLWLLCSSNSATNDSIISKMYMPCAKDFLQ